MTGARSECVRCGADIGARLTRCPECSRGVNDIIRRWHAGGRDLPARSLAAELGLERNAFDMRVKRLGLSKPRSPLRQGEQFSRLTAVAPVPSQPGVMPSKKKWECLCQCGRVTLVITGNLRSGQTRSCGCLAREFRASLKEFKRGKVFRRAG